MTVDRRQARAQRACTHCRQRKMRCTGERPRCKNCEIYDSECVFAVSARKSRPTNAAINALMEENRRLRKQTSTQDGQSRDTDDAAEASQPEASSSTAAPFVRATATPEAQTPPVSSSKTPADTPCSVGGTSTYHGPTSTLHDDTPTVSRSWLSKEREAWMPKLLVAAAAEQRQYEGINARAGKLDFDGVDPELGTHLLNLHWNRQHHSFLVTYRPAFMRDMACNGPYFSKILLNAIYYGASKFSPRLDLRKNSDDVRTAGWQFRNRVRDLLGEALDHSEITTIQALLQMSNSLFALGDEQSAAWVYAGTAFRMLVDLGLHVDATLRPNVSRLSEEDLEIRRRVYWSAFVVDKMQSLYQGRPASLSVRDGEVPIAFLDTFEELEFWQPFAYTNETSYPGSPSFSVSTFKELCRLCIILHDVLDRMYCEGKEKRPTDELVQDLETLESRMQHWKSSLPEHLTIHCSSSDVDHHLPPPHVFSLQATYNALRVLLHRPLVADGHLHTTLPATSKSSFIACTEAAMNIVRLVRLYDKAFSVRRAPYLISYSTYVAATIHVRIAATRTPGSEAHDHLRTCLAVFDQNSETNYAVRKASLVVKGLMKRMGVSNGDSQAGVFQNSDAVNERTSQTHPVDQTTLVDAHSSSRSAAHPREQTFIDPEPTMIAGQFVPDLDVDAIIHSFMQDQHMAGFNPALMPMTSEDAYHASANDSGMLGMDQMSVPSEGYANFDDALFGFNASAFDWDNPNLMNL